jgi:hypothetical protein
MKRTIVAVLVLLAAGLSTPLGTLGQQVPPPAEVEAVRLGVEGICRTALPSNFEACMAIRLKSEKFKRFRFNTSRTPTDADYGWLTEFNLDDCEAKAKCLVVFTAFVTGTESSSWRFVLQVPAGNFDSISYSKMVTVNPEDPESKFAILKVRGLGDDGDDLIWLYDRHTFAYEAYGREEFVVKQQKLPLTLAARRQDFKALGLHRLQSQAQVKDILTSQGFALWQCSTERTILVASGFVTNCLASRRRGSPDQDNVILIFNNVIHNHRDTDSGIVRTDGVERVLLVAKYAREGDDEESVFGADNKPF